MARSRGSSRMDTRKARYLLGKRLLDVLVSLLLSPVLALMIPIMWIAGIIEGCPSLFFRQTRVGLGGEKISIVKFRTLGGTRGFWLTDSVLKGARLLALDELPQILMVLNGQMTCVGPRPLLHEDLYQYCEVGNSLVAQAIAMRQALMPGLTGVSQISMTARRRSGIAYWRMLGYDLWYFNNASGMVDLLVLLFTPVYLFSLGRLCLPAGGSRGAAQFAEEGEKVESQADLIGAPCD